MSDDDEEHYGELIPPDKQNRVTRLYDPQRALAQDAHFLDPDWGLGNMIQRFCHNSSARLMDARTADVAAWTRFLRSLDDLYAAMMDRERWRRRLENLDQVLNEEEAHDRHLTKLRRKTEIVEAERRLLEAERARDRINGVVPKEKGVVPREKKETDPFDRLKRNHAEIDKVRRAGEKIIEEIKKRAKEAGIPDDDKGLRRDIENAREDIERTIARIREKM